VWTAPPSGANDGTPYEFSARGQIWGQGATSTSAPVAVDLAAYLRNVTGAHCAAVNAAAGMGGIPADNDDLNQVHFNGVYPTSVAQYDNVNGCPAAAPCATVPESPLNGHAYGCFEEEMTGQNIIYNTLVAR
jgi:hypothetical protein